jgi:hypothetical protein
MFFEDGVDIHMWSGTRDSAATQSKNGELKLQSPQAIHKRCDIAVASRWSAGRTYSEYSSGIVGPLRCMFIPRPVPTVTFS